MEYLEASSGGELLPHRSEEAPKEGAGTRTKRGYGMESLAAIQELWPTAVNADNPWQPSKEDTGKSIP